MKSSEYVVLQAEEDELQQKAFKVRREVFVDEQKVPPEAEFDEYESVASHFVVIDKFGEGVGAARWRHTDKGIKLERFAVAKNHRSKGVGSLLLESTLDNIRQTGKSTYLYLHAQLDAIPLYLKFDFKVVGSKFVECSIEHFKMELRTE